MSKKINELRQKINELEAALQKDNLSEQAHEAISRRLYDVKSQLTMWQNSNNKGE
jgi:hypothetical protein